MKFLSPGLLVRINEAQGEEAESLYAQWEAIGQAERAYYAEIKDRIPPKLAEFIETIFLHDADCMGINVAPSYNGSQLDVIAINVRQQDNVITLVYDLLEQPQWSGPSPESRIWNDEQVLWLYDEIGLLNDTTFTHEILLSNGRVLRLAIQLFRQWHIGKSWQIGRFGVNETDLPGIKRRRFIAMPRSSMALSRPMRACRRRRCPRRRRS